MTIRAASAGMGSTLWTLPLSPSGFNVAAAVLGGFLSTFGLVSYLLKEHYYLPEALISLLTGIVVGPDGLGFIRPGDYTGCDVDGISTVDCRKSLSAITLNFSRLVLCIQLVLAGVQLPSKYLKRECKSLLLLIGPGMAAMWLTTSYLVWMCIDTPSFLHALAIGACVTPTDPVLSAVIVKGRFADQNIPRELQDLIIAESGFNDGLGYPFLFFALYLIKFAGAGADSGPGRIADAMSLWLVLTLGYTILFSILYGAVVGWAGKRLLQWAEKNKYIDHESFLMFAIALALFLLGTCGLLGTDEVLACFIAGNAFTWDDWFRLRTKDDSLQPTIDMLLNVTIFLWYGASLPWNSFVDTPNISLWRLLILGALVLAFRRLPWIVAMRQWIPQLENARQAVFAGFFGPIGVSAVFYLFIALDFIESHLGAGQGNPGPRTDVMDLAQTLRTVVWFLVVCSIVIHGLAVPLGKASYMGPQTLSRVLSISLSEENRLRVPAAVFPRIRIPVLPKPLDAKLGDIESTPVRHTESVEEARAASADTHHGLPDVDLLVDVR
ncbi:Sodium/hydrogen exchanger family-domain-containing protein [Aspergillus keveii]|uniref:Sodium/hydrogen exchanger family-domain-containing protein n=1 Tax=Aspergillus keveii TaxID=714993 RepID=A0ABR4FWR2_9EURO